MSVGLPLTKTDLDARAWSGVTQLWGALNQMNELSQLLANTTIIPNDAALVALGYTSAEVTLLRAAVNDLGSATGLWGVAHNLKTVTSANNFFFNAQQITGVNFSG
jgi:hypothetical protein